EVLGRENRQYPAAPKGLVVAFPFQIVPAGEVERLEGGSMLAEVLVVPRSQRDTRWHLDGSRSLGWWGTGGCGRNLRRCRPHRSKGRPANEIRVVLRRQAARRLLAPPPSRQGLVGVPAGGA